MDFTFPHNLESGQRVAIILTPAGADTEFYVLDENTSELDIRERIEDTGRRLAAIINVE